MDFRLRHGMRREQRLDRDRERGARSRDRYLPSFPARTRASRTRAQALNEYEQRTAETPRAV